MAKPPTLALVLVALVAVVLPAGAAAGESGPPDVTRTASPSPSAWPSPSSSPSAWPSPSTSPSTSPSPSASPSPSPTPTEEVPDDAPRIDLEERESVSQLRHLGVSLSGANLPPSTALTLTLDGRVVRELTTSDDGTLRDVLVRFPGIGPGDHVVGLEVDGEPLVSAPLAVADDLFEVTVSPRWITPQTLRTKGAHLLVGREFRSHTMDQDFDAFVVRRTADGAVDEVPVGRGSTRDDGTVDITITGDAAAFPGGTGTVHSVGLRSDFLPFLFSYTELRLTELSATRSEQDGAITGVGFEPGTTVELVVDGRVVDTAPATSAGSVRFGRGPLALESVLLRSPAGEVGLAVTPLPAELTALAQSLKAREQAVATIRGTSETLAAAVGPGSIGKPFTPAQTTALEQQVLAQERLFGPYPAQDLAGSKAGRIGAGPGAQAPVPGKGAGLSDYAAGAGTSIQVDAGGLAQAQAKKVEAEGERAAADAVAAQQAGDLSKEIQERLDEMITSIIRFVKEMQQAQVDAMRAITRASTPEVVARAVVSADTSVTVEIPTDFRGRHHVVVIDAATGLVLSWQPVDVVAEASGPDGADGGQGGADTAAGAALPDTGADVGRELVPLGLALVLAGAAVTVLGRRRRA